MTWWFDITYRLIISTGKKAGGQIHRETVLLLKLGTSMGCKYRDEGTTKFTDPHSPAVLGHWSVEQIPEFCSI